MLPQSGSAAGRKDGPTILRRFDWGRIGDIVKLGSLATSFHNPAQQLAMTSPLADNELYTLYRDDPQGEGRAAFNTLVERHHGRLVNRVTKRLNILTASAEDIVQNVFMQLMKAADKFDPEKNTVVGWMNWLADNRARNEKRDRYRRPVLDSDWTAGDKITHKNDMLGNLEGSSPYARELQNLEAKAISREPDPDYEATQDELIAAFWEFTTSLEPRLRDTIIMVFVEGRQHTEVARSLGVDRKTITRRLKVLLPQLQRAIGEDMLELKANLERREHHRMESIAVCA